MECPTEPDESECCNSGCNPCIFDVYEKQLQKYKKSQFETTTSKKNCLKELKYVPFKLINIINDSLHANIYIFECNSHFSDTEQVYYEPGQHLLVKGQSKFDQSDFSRAYTPIPWDGLAANQFAMLIKLYPAGDMSQSLKILQIGDETLWRGPYGDFMIDYKQKGLLMIAQGTGIAPLFAIIKKILGDDECEVRIKLIYCCRDLKQIHLRNQVYELLDYWNFNYELFLSCQGDLKSKSEDLDEHFEETSQGQFKVTENKFQNEVKYKEVVHCKKFDDNDVKSLLIDENGEENWSQVLICGTEAFSKSIADVIKQYSTISVHSF